MYRVYIWDRKLNENEGINTWSGEVKSILNEHNLGQSTQSDSDDECRWWAGSECKHP